MKTYENMIPKDWPVISWAESAGRSFEHALRFRGLEMPNEIEKSACNPRCPYVCGISWIWLPPGGERVSISIVPGDTEGWYGVMSDTRTGECYRRIIPVLTAMHTSRLIAVAREWACWLRGRVPRSVERVPTEDYDKVIYEHWHQRALAAAEADAPAAIEPLVTGNVEVGARIEITGVEEWRLETLRLAMTMGLPVEVRERSHAQSPSPTIRAARWPSRQRSGTSARWSASAHAAVTRRRSTRAPPSARTARTRVSSGSGSSRTGKVNVMQK